ncbi:MAG: Type 1 glutamine amidotransferase-like domain-containing protein [Desulfobacterales bacterium]|jgi:cyanophycinase
MSGHLLLAGGAEFGGQMAAPDRKALAAAGGPEAPVAIIPAAAAPDHNAERAGHKAVRWFQSLGAGQVEALPLVDRASADEPAIAARLRRARLIYLLGGFPAHLAESLRESLSWRALREAYRNGAVIAGSSAGAMVLGRRYYDPFQSVVKPGLDLIGPIGVIPHHAAFGQRWVAILKTALPSVLLMGIDEETGALAPGIEGTWQVFGKGRVVLYAQDQTASFGHGQVFCIGDYR